LKQRKAGIMPAFLFVGQHRASTGRSLRAIFATFGPHDSGAMIRIKPIRIHKSDGFRKTRA
jgi:hypothetical protein